MIGNLTIDKASMNLSYFLNSVRIIHANGGRMSRRDFVQEMAQFIGVPAQKNGKENRTPYNKSKLPRYFGFVDIDVDAEGTSYLVTTNRGKKLVQYITENETTDTLQKYCISPKHRDEFIDLIFESVIFDSFGKNNCGAEQSSTDVEPPKIVFKAIQALGKATAEEICYIIFGLNKGIFYTFEEAISKIKDNRDNYKYDYSEIMEDWKITNIVNDCKIINVFTDDSIQLLTSSRDEELEKVFYYLSPALSQRHLDQISTINAIYQPLRLFVYTDGNDSTIQEWVSDAVLGRVSDNSFVFQYDSGNLLCGDLSADIFRPGVFEVALLKAFQNPKKNVFLILNHITEEQITALLGEYVSLLQRVNDLRSERHAWSTNPIENSEVYKYLVSNSNEAKKVLANDKVYLPSNLQIVGTIIMEKMTENKVFDYEFTRAFVKTSGNPSIGRNLHKHLDGGSNMLLYGVPGCGKSHTIKEKYCNDESVMERIVFHPDYTNSDFIGQILPINDNGKISYEFTPGPFTRILHKAWLEPEKMFYLVIEEINRGNAPAIFGEVFQLLDRVNGESEYGISNPDMAKSIYLKDEDKDNPEAVKAAAEHTIKIPSNVTILATMNTADQNVFTLDTAFKRRWKMVSIPNNFDSCELKDIQIGDTGLSWKMFAEVINDMIVDANLSSVSSEDKRLGAYFASEEQLKDKKMFSEKVLAYLWDDVFKYDREKLFNSDIRTLEDLIKEFESDGLGVFNSEVRNTFNVKLQDVQ